MAKVRGIAARARRVLVVSSAPTAGRPAILIVDGHADTAEGVQLLLEMLG
jgi:hypothetical protein